MQLGHVIAKLREEKKLSQKQLANDLHVSSGVVGMWETDKRHPSLEMFIQIIDYFGISADFLLENDRKLRPEQYLKRTATVSPEYQKILTTFCELNDDNKDILIGEAKKLLKNQRTTEKRESLSQTAKAT